jgi:2-Cys peroxiredoxin 5
LNDDNYKVTCKFQINLADLCANKKVIIFGVPGAFTPGCSKTHLPGYVQKADELRKSGVQEIACVSVNDAFVMGAWAQQHNTKGKLRMLADPAGKLAKELDLEIDLPPLGGKRLKRFSMIVENGVVKTLNIEPDGTGLSCSLAEKIKV